MLVYYIFSPLLEISFSCLLIFAYTMSYLPYSGHKIMFVEWKIKTAKEKQHVTEMVKNHIVLILGGDRACAEPHTWAPEVTPITEAAVRMINSILNGSFLNIDKYQEICYSLIFSGCSRVITPSFILWMIQHFSQWIWRNKVMSRLEKSSYMFLE